MATFDEILALKFSDAPESQETLGTTYAYQRIPYKVMDAHNQATDEYPYILDITNAGGWVTRGVHPYASLTAGNNTGQVLRYQYGTHRDDLMSWITVRMILGQDVNVGPACRLDVSGAKCYTVEVYWNAAGGGRWDAQVYRYDSNSSKTAIGSAITFFISPLLAAAWKFWMIGIQAVTNGSTVNVFLYKALLLQPGATPGSMPGSITNIVPKVMNAASGSPVSDSSGSRLLSPTQIYTGIKWKYAGAPVTAHTETRLVTEWGTFQSFSGSQTQPSTPTLTLTSSEGRNIHAASSTFFDSDGSDSHVKTRWLLYEAIGNSFMPWPVFDSDFQSSNLLSYTFSDLAPGKQYAVRVQYLDNESGGGDVSGLSGFTLAEVTGQPTGLLSAFSFAGRSSHSGFPRNNTLTIIDPALTTVEEVWKFVNDGVLATSVGPVIARYDRPSGWTQLYRRIVFRDPRYISGTNNPLYTTVIGTMAFLKWSDADTKLAIGTRCTSPDQDGFYITKTVSGGNSNYAVTRRQLTGSNPNSSVAGDWSNTVVIGPVAIPTSSIGINGERIVLLSYDLGGTKNLVAFVNGMMIGSVSGSSANLGFDANHQWSALLIQDNPTDFLIQQFGQMSISTPAFPIVIDAETAATGAGMHQPGPFLDPFDSGTDVGGVPNVFWQSGGKFRFRTGAGTTDVLGNGWLIFSGLSLPTYNYSVKSTFYNGCGPVARFTSPLNAIYMTVTNVAGNDYTYTLYFLEGGSVLASYTCTVTDASYAASGAEIIMQVTTDLGNGSGDPIFATSSSRTLQVRAYYNGTIMTWTGSVTTINRSVSSSSALLAGRFGVFRHPRGGAGNDILVCGTIEAYDSTSIHAPETPEVVSESNEQTVKISFTLSASSFSDQDPGATHNATEWEVYRHPAGTLLWQSGTDLSNLTAITITPGVGTWYPTGGETEGFDTNTSYKARVRYRDNSGIWSQWSGFLVFTTSMVTASNVSIQNLPTYPTTPLVSQTFEETVQFNTTISLSESGKEQRKAKWTTPRRLFRLRYDNRVSSEIDTIWDFYRNIGFGRLNLFYFIHPITGVAYIARFLEDGLSRQTIEYEIQSTGLAIIEVPV